MKKVITTMLAIMLAISTVGCKKDNKSIETVNNITADTQSSDITDESNSQDLEINTELSTEKATESIATEPVKTETTVSETSTNEVQATTQTILTETPIDTTENINELENDYTDIAYIMYINGVKMYSDIILSCPYALDYENIDLNGFIPINEPTVTSVEDVATYYCTVFAEPDSYIYERYIEKDGKVFCNDAARGSNIYYSGTDLEFVSENNGTLTFNAISHYNDPDTGEAMKDEISTFSMISTDNGYRISEFDYPQ